MKKIMFNDRLGLTQAVLEGRKTMTRRIASIQPPYEKNEIAFPVFAGDGEDSPLWLAYCWVDKDNPGEHTKWIKPQYKKEGEIIAIAQSYKDLGYDPDSLDRDPKDLGIKGFMKDSADWNNKMFVRAAGCKHHIRVTNVKIQQLQDISDEDCLKEGIIKGQRGSKANGMMDAYYIPNDNQPYCTPKDAFEILIDQISGKGTWERNPWVWVYEFELVK